MLKILRVDDLVRCLDHPVQEQVGVALVGEVRVVWSSHSGRQ